MKKFLILLCSMFAIPIAVCVADEIGSNVEIDLDSIRNNVNNDSAEIRMKIYNDNYKRGTDDLYYGMYYLKIDCKQKAYKTVIIEGYNIRNELMLVDYDSRDLEYIATGSDIELAYKYACGVIQVPAVKKQTSKQSSKNKDNN